MLFSFLVTLREGVEIALVLAIVLGYLGRTGNRRHFRPIWIGAASAAAVSVAFTGILQVTAARLSGQALEAFEGVTMLAAVGVLTWMVFWTRKQAASIGRELREQVESAIRRGSLVALVGLAFSAVAREGIETALFLFAGAQSQAGGGWAFVLGGLLGFGLSGLIGVVIYAGSHRLPLRPFFLVSGVAVLVLSAGLLTNGISELQHSGLVPNLGPRPWDSEALIASTSMSGKFLHTLIGYDSSPTLGQVLAYFGYLGAGLALFLSDLWPRRVPAVVGPES